MNSVFKRRSSFYLTIVFIHPIGLMIACVNVSIRATLMPQSLTLATGGTCSEWSPVNQSILLQLIYTLNLLLSYSIGVPCPENTEEIHNLTLIRRRLI